MKCDWCLQNKDEQKGRFKQGAWICHVCFPMSGGLIPIRKCESCGGRNKKGGVLSGKFVCSDCNGFLIESKQHHNHGKKRKKKQPIVYSPVAYKADQQVQKNRHERRAKKKKRIVVRYTVKITEISYGEL